MQAFIVKSKTCVQQDEIELIYEFKFKSQFGLEFLRFGTDVERWPWWDFEFTITHKKKTQALEAAQW